MGKKTGFLDYARETSYEVPPTERIKNFDEFHIPCLLKNSRNRVQDVWTVVFHFVSTARRLKVCFLAVL